MRDKIVESQLASGARPSYRKLSPEEHAVELVNKIIEEAKEIAGAEKDEAVHEIADVQQAIDDLKELLDITHTEVSEAQAAKNAKAGAFKQGLYVEHVEVDENDPWTEHFRARPDHYPEID